MDTHIPVTLRTARMLLRSWNPADADLFPRAVTGRVPLGAADRMELGYWLDEAVTGRGLATEATRALLDMAAGVPGMSHVEIRCDRGNAPSAALPRRLGFHLASVEAELQIWRKPLRVPPGNRLDKLKGDRTGQRSIRVNDQWRICFRWKDGDAHEVEIVDYH